MYFVSCASVADAENDKSDRHTDGYTRLTRQAVCASWLSILCLLENSVISDEIVIVSACYYSFSKTYLNV